MEPTPAHQDCNNGVETPGGQGGCALTVLNEPHRTKSDCKLTTRAVLGRWPIDPDKRRAIVDRLTEIVERKEVTVATQTGTATVQAPADSNSIAASRVLASMDALNQSDEHADMKNERLDGGKATENVATTINVEFDNAG